MPERIPRAFVTYDHDPTTRSLDPRVDEVVQAIRQLGVIVNVPYQRGAGNVRVYQNIQRAPYENDWIISISDTSPDPNAPFWIARVPRLTGEPKPTLFLVRKGIQLPQVVLGAASVLESTSLREYSNPDVVIPVIKEELYYIREDIAKQEANPV